MDALCPYRVCPLMFDGPGFSVRPSRLWREGREAQLRSWSESVGLELRDGERYLLFESTRLDGRADHEVTAQPTRRFFDRMWHLTPEWRKASVSLAPGRRIHEGDRHDAVVPFEKAQRYVDAFYSYGTHFISAVERGDRLVQVAAVRAEAAAEVCGFWAAQGAGGPVSGVAALPFGAFLGARHARAVGPIVSRAGDPRLAISLGAGLWTDPRSLSGSSLLQPWRSGAQRAAEQLQSFDASAPLSIELTSLARFVEYYRAINFERILRGALLQRWGDRVVLPVRRMPGVERTIARSSSGAAGALGSRVLSYGRREQVRCAEQGPLLAQVVGAALDSQDAPSLELSTAAFEQGGLVCQTLSGVLTLSHGPVGERDVVVDGLRFAAAGPDPVAGWPRVRVRGDLHHVQPGQLAPLLPSLKLALAELSATSARAVDGERRGDAASFADWLSSLLPVRSPDPELARLRVCASYLAHIEPKLPTEHEGLELSAQRRCDTQLAAMAKLALQLDELFRDHEAQSWALSRAPTGTHADAQRERRRQTTERVRRARRQLGERHSLLLRELEAPLISASRRAASACEHAGEQLLRLTAALGDSSAAEDADAGELLDLLASAPSRGTWRKVEELRLRASRDPLVAAGRNAAAREAHLRGELDWLEAIEEAWAAASRGGETFDAFEDSVSMLAARPALESGPVLAPPSEKRMLRALLLRGAHPGPDREQAVDALLASWETFENTRSHLSRARGVLCRLRFESWLQGRVLQQGAEEEATGSGPSRSGSHDVVLERFSVLTTLGQALRWQRGGLGPLAAAAVPAQPEPGALGRLIQQGLGSAALGAVARFELQAIEDHA